MVVQERRGRRNLLHDVSQPLPAVGEEDAHVEPRQAVVELRVPVGLVHPHVGQLCWSRRWPSSSCCCWNAGDRLSTVTRHTHNSHDELELNTSISLHNRRSLFECVSIAYVQCRYMGQSPSPATTRSLLDPAFAPRRATCTTTMQWR